MNVTIRDRTVYETLNPANVAAYLASAGWDLSKSRPGHSSLWHTTFEGDSVELLLPLNPQFKDYVERMAETIPLIAAIEKRSQLEVLSDIQTANADVVRIRYRYASANDGSIPLDRGEAIVENTRELLMAGACAALSKRPYYASLKPQQARDYVQKLRLGQTERGSYVLTVLSPVPPELKPSKPTIPGLEEPPYERLALTQLSKALSSLRDAADEAMTSLRMDAFDRAIQDGVSANLCSALVGIGGTAPQTGDKLSIAFTWARSRPADSNIAREIVFPGDRFTYIAQAARLYKGSDTSDDTEIRGVIMALKTEHSEGPPVGPVTIRDFTASRPRKVLVHLDELSHKAAVQAYEKRYEVSCRGVITRSGNNLTIQQPRDFMVLTDE